jgi:hypothetical protein
MSTRTMQSVVRFSSPFLLHSLDVPLPAGEYRVEQDEELIEGISWLAYRRVATFIHLPAIAIESQAHQIIEIDPADLETALEKDSKQS